MLKKEGWVFYFKQEVQEGPMEQAFSLKIPNELGGLVLRISKQGNSKSHGMS